ncbi:MAG: C40 family peptidase [Oscillospiraceae bacterium]|nr:C40 family peptidase [Oscillospiraceae bacterium]
MSRRAPRLLFTKEEQETPELKKAVRKAEKRMNRLEQAEAKIPQKKVRERIVDAKTGSITTRISFVEKKPPSKLKHRLEAVPGETVLTSVHREVRRSEQDNAGVEGAHSAEQAAECGGRLMQSSHRSQQLKPFHAAARAEVKADSANLHALYKVADIQNPRLSSNPYSRWQQRRAIRKEYARAKKAGAGTVSAAQTTVRAARQAVEESGRAAAFAGRHKKELLIFGGIFAVFLLFASLLSSCSVLFSAVGGDVNVSTYPSEDADMLAAEAAYCAMEQELQDYLDDYESTHSYDEYHYELDDIGHDPYVLISAVTALYGGAWTIDDVDDILQFLFDYQYTLTESVTVESGYDANDEPYDYYISTVALENFNLSHVLVYVMSEVQLSMYAVYMSTLGNRPDLFPDSSYIGLLEPTEYADYEVSAEALEDEQFATLIAEAEKYLGFPYVWGGSSPSTSFDCSGFVSWVINNCGVGWNVGRLSANGLLNICTRIFADEAQPGDLIFFENTYDTAGASHVGIYVGDGMMIHCGSPIQYTSINTSYWQSHLLCFGRLPNP